MNVRNKLSIIASKDSPTSIYDEKENILYFKGSSLELATIILNYPYGDLRILSSRLITEEILDAIRKNSYVMLLKLGCSDEAYSLTRKGFDILNSSSSLLHIDVDQVSGEYTIDEMSILSCFNQICIGNYKILDLYTNQSFSFYQSLSSKEIELLVKYMQPNKKMFFMYDDYSNIISVIEALQGRDITFTFSFSHELVPYYNQLENLFRKNEKIESHSSVNLAQQIKTHSLLDLMVRDIRESSLSVYEKYLAVINIVTHFKPYQENNSRKMEARLTERILFNEYIVCLGYVNLMRDLLELIGVCSYPIEVILEDEKDNEYHARIIVRLDDEKYNIHGLFVADPTWDEAINHFYFNHASMTFYETLGESARFRESELSIFAVDSSLEFIKKLECYPYACRTFLDIIKNVDKDYYHYLKRKYDLDVSNMNFVLDIYNYIIENTKKRVSKQDQFKAVSALIQFIYPTLSSEKKSELLEEIKEENAKREQYYFKEGRKR